MLGCQAQVQPARRKYAILSKQYLWQRVVSNHDDENDDHDCDMYVELGSSA